MARNTNVTLTAGAWTQLTAGDISAITFQNVSNAPAGAGYEIVVKATVGANAPNSVDGAIRYDVGEGERVVALADLFPGISGANRVYAWAAHDGVVMVSHA